MDEEQMYSKEVGTAARASSIMSPDRPTSPVSVSSSDPDHPHHRDRGAPSTPHLPHHSSGAARVTTPTPLHPTDPNRSVATTHDPAFEVDFTEHDAANPRNWSRWYRGTILAVMSYGTTTSVMFSTSYTSAVPGLQTSFGISEDVAILGVTTYLLGLAIGALLLAPLSEMYGRRPVYMVANALFVVWVIPCAVADDMATILVSRFCAAFCASALISNAPGSLNDITEDHHRALAFSIWSIGPMNGPAIGPVVGGFVFQYLGWRWTNWVIVIAASVAWVGTSAVGETYAPAILRKRAARKRRET
ncbi:Fungal trichothecene efflux pump (TRI12), partial [Teratosphaeria destructans]